MGRWDGHAPTHRPPRLSMVLLLTALGAAMLGTNPHPAEARADDPCLPVLTAANPSALSDDAWAACYRSKAPELVGGYTMRGTNHWKNGSNLPFTVQRACVCSCEGTADGVFCNGTIGAQQGPLPAAPGDSSSFTLAAWIPDATLVARATPHPPLC